MEKKPYVPKKSMKWYNFLVYFGMFAISLIYFICAYNILTGRVYGDDGEFIYYFLADEEGLFIDVVDALYGLSFIALGILYLLVWYPLFKKKKNSKKLLVTTNILSAVFSFLYVVAFIVLLIISDFMVDLMGETSLKSVLIIAIANIIISVLMAFSNARYFKNRKHLFQ